MINNDLSRRPQGWKKPIRVLVVFCALATMAAGFSATAASGQSQFTRLKVAIEKASVAPDGHLAGAATDLIVTFRDIDPEVLGVGLKEGGTVRVKLPKSFVNDRGLPIASTGSGPGCAPPLVNACSTAVLTQGWPQSPVPPFPTTSYEADTNTIVLTANADWAAINQAQPGPKQVHLMLFGFSNPQRPGSYRIGVEINPDPNSSAVLRGSGRVEIARRTTPSISPNSLSNGAPPPPFPNPLFQSKAPGQTSDVMTFYLWDRDANAYIGVDFAPGSDKVRPIRDADGRRIGSVKVLPPPGAENWSLESGGPSSLANAFITGLPVGRLTATLQTDGEVTGTYKLRFKLRNGDTVSHTIRTAFPS